MTLALVDALALGGMVVAGRDLWLHFRGRPAYNNP